MMMRSFASKSVAAKRAFSTARMTVAQNIMVLEQMSQAGDAAALTAAGEKKALDVANLPASLSTWGAYLGSGAAGGEAAYKPNPNAWQNKYIGGMMVEDFSRTEMWPFLATAL